MIHAHLKSILCVYNTASVKKHCFFFFLKMVPMDAFKHAGVPITKISESWA